MVRHGTIDQAESERSIEEPEEMKWPIVGHEDAMGDNERATLLESD